jgi:hypothetical protein
MATGKNFHFRLDTLSLLLVEWYVLRLSYSILELLHQNIILIWKVAGIDSEGVSLESTARVYGNL